MDETLIATVRGWLRNAERIVVLTGAGISTDSGIPDFRGPQGVWTKNPGAEKMATLQHYVADPEVRKRAWRSRMDTFARSVEPNAGHRALVELEHRGTLLALLTQNVDGLHQAAGNSPDKIVEIHGTIREVVCLDRKDGKIAWQYQGTPPTSFFSATRGGAQPLANGNVLITETTKGHVFEVTRAGKIVWEFWNTDFDGGARHSIYRMRRIPLEAYGALRGLGDAARLGGRAN